MRSYHSLEHVAVLLYFLFNHIYASKYIIFIERSAIYLSSYLLEMCILMSFENVHTSIISITLYQQSSYSRVCLLDSDWMPKILYRLYLKHMCLFNSLIETFPFAHRFFNNSRKFFRIFFLKKQWRKCIRLWCFYPSGERNNLVFFWILSSKKKKKTLIRRL